MMAMGFDLYVNASAFQHDYGGGLICSTKIILNRRVLISLLLVHVLVTVRG